MDTINTNEEKGCLLFFLITVAFFLFIYNNNIDGKRCAYVSIYNIETGNESESDLQVEIDDYKVVKIYFENGRWLDDSHFRGNNQLDGDYASFKDDRGREISIILKDDNDCE